jgi:hypothetical protein
MENTSFTIGGFTQPSVAKSIIEQLACVEKGLCQRFLWLFPKPSFVWFNTLESVDDTFTKDIGK